MGYRDMLGEARSLTPRERQALTGVVQRARDENAGTDGIARLMAATWDVLLCVLDDVTRDHPLTA